MPVGLGVAVGKAIINHMNGNIWDENEFLGFKYSRYNKTSDQYWLNKSA